MKSVVGKIKGFTDKIKYKNELSLMWNKFIEDNITMLPFESLCVLFLQQEQFSDNDNFNCMLNQVRRGKLYKMSDFNLQKFTDGILEVESGLDLDRDKFIQLYRFLKLYDRDETFLQSVSILLLLSLNDSMWKEEKFLNDEERIDYRLSLVSTFYGEWYTQLMKSTIDGIINRERV